MIARGIDRSGTHLNPQLECVARAAAALLAAALAGCATPPGSAPAAGIAFALIGDMPYSAREAEAVDALIDAINADAAVAFVLHAGDIKGGVEPCSDELLRARHAQLQRIRTALVYTPGDNEWTDCHRGAAGRFNPLERLAFLRALFFPDPHHSGGRQPFAVETQGAQPGFDANVENVLFVRERVVFATLHVVGSDNGLKPWTGLDAADTRTQPRADRLRDVEQRSAAALRWVDHVFARARAVDAAGVLLLMQANPRFDLPPTDPERAPFEPLLQRLRERAARFARPVVLAHGDFHELIVDHPLSDVSNLVRVQTFGSPRIRWLRVRVDPASPEVFHFTPR
jgi:hypothetical protein